MSRDNPTIDGAFVRSPYMATYCKADTYLGAVISVSLALNNQITYQKKRPEYHDWTGDDGPDKHF